MQGYLPQQQFAGLPAQCFLTPGFSQQQQQPSPYGAYNQYFNNPYQQQPFFYPQQQPQFSYFPQQQQYSFIPQQQQYPFVPQQQQYPFYAQQQAQFYPQQQPLFNWPQNFAGQSAYGYQQYWPQQQQRVFENPKTPIPSPARREKEKPKKFYERVYS
ncbi:unnamed protein product [Adineta ricciae]|uniref:Uncharacterized protein n=1 Tax=Adineta ricciae TaxID=249248 RepID=A0A815GVF9_ADIRI|nr:unnamed protein product [Adineta ricciae]